MEKEGRFLTMVLALLVLIIAVHSTVHFSKFGAGFSGLAVDNSATNGQNSNILQFSGSLIFLILEWAILIGGLIYSYTKFKFALNKEYEELNSIKDRQFSANTTDIDKMFEFLKEKKSLRVSTIAKVFEVDKSLVESWGKTLESAKFATISYPRIGGPKITIKEKEVKHDQEEN